MPQTYIRTLPGSIGRKFFLLTGQAIENLEHGKVSWIVINNHHIKQGAA
jgi:hypothetical protein